MQPPGRQYLKDEVVYTDWFPRGGDGIILRLEVIDLNGGSIDVDVYTKNAADTGDGTIISSWTTLHTLDSVGLKQMIKISDSGAGSVGLLQLVRLKITGHGTNAYDWTLARFFPPIFFDAAAN